MIGETALRIVLDQVKDVAYSDTSGGVFSCARCGAQIYGLDEGDWLECILVKAFDHRCAA